MAITASASQTASHSAGDAVRPASQPATRAEVPMATPPHPGTPVKDEARAMVSRM
jgi:hypothetical protein